MTNRKQIKDDKVTVLKIISTIVLASLVVSSVGFSTASAATVTSSIDYSSIVNQARSKGRSIDTGRAVSLALASQDFVSAAKGRTISYNSAYDILSYSFDSNGSPVVTLKSTNVVYSIQDANGHSKNIIVSEDPGLLQVTGVNVQDNVPHHSKTAPAICIPYCVCSPPPQPLQLYAQGIQPFCGGGGGGGGSPPPDFSISANPTSLTIPAGGASTSTITITSLNGFSGTVTLTTSVSPSGGSSPTATIPSSVNVPSAGSATATLNVATTRTTSTASFTVTITGSQGSLAHASTVMVTNTCYYSTSSQTIWSGYELAASCGAGDPSQYISSAIMNWKVPGVSEPQSYWCWFAHCDLSLWAGLANAPGGAYTPSCPQGCIVQAGTDSGIDCNPACINYYSGWYEFLPASSVNCLGYLTASPPVNPGDKFYLSIGYNRNAHTFGISMIDSNTNAVCDVFDHPFAEMGDPFFAEFIAEPPLVEHQRARLPKFDPVILDAKMSTPDVAAAYNNQWYEQYDMWNGPNHNIALGPMTTQTWSGTSEPGFTVNWLTSAGT